VRGRRSASTHAVVADRVLETPDSTVLDLIDELLNKGVVADGDLTLGVAGIDLIYLRLSALLCAADRVLPIDPEEGRRRLRRYRNPAPRDRE
jgi:hypothetical protein